VSLLTGESDIILPAVKRLAPPDYLSVTVVPVPAMCWRVVIERLIVEGHGDDGDGSKHRIGDSYEQSECEKTRRWRI